MAPSSDSGPVESEDLLPVAVAERLPAPLRTDEGYRAVLGQLVARGGSCPLAALTEALVEEADWPPDGAASSNPYQLTHLALVRQYLPVLGDFGVVEYDEDDGTVTVTPTEGAAPEPADTCR